MVHELTHDAAVVAATAPSAEEGGVAEPAFPEVPIARAVVPARGEE